MYTIQLQGWSGTPVPLAYSSVVLDVQLGTSITARAGGGATRTVDAGAPLALDASPTFDPDYPELGAAGLAYIWDCRTEAGRACGILDDLGSVASPLTSATTLIAAPDVTAPTTLIFSFLAMKGSKNGTSAEFEVNVVPAPKAFKRGAGRPAARVHNVSVVRVNVAETLILSGQTDIPFNVSLIDPGYKMQWRWQQVVGNLPCAVLADTPPCAVVSATSPNIQSSTPYGRTPHANNAQFLILPNVLTAGERYTFRLWSVWAPESLSAGDDEGQLLVNFVNNQIAAQLTSFSEMAVDVNSPPMDGVVSVAPTSGVVYSTTFAFSTDFWTDPEEDYPLRYTFEYASTDPETGVETRNRLGDPTEANKAATTLPQGFFPSYNLTVWAICVDYKGAETRSAPTVVQVGAPVVSSEAELNGLVEAETGNMIEKGAEQGDPSLVLDAFGSAASVLGGAAASRRRRRRLGAVVAVDTKAAEMRQGYIGQMASIGNGTSMERTGPVLGRQMSTMQSLSGSPSDLVPVAGSTASDPSATMMGFITNIADTASGTKARRRRLNGATPSAPPSEEEAAIPLDDGIATASAEVLGAVLSAGSIAGASESWEFTAEQRFGAMSTGYVNGVDALLVELEAAGHAYTAEKALWALQKTAPCDMPAPPCNTTNITIDVMFKVVDYKIEQERLAGVGDMLGPMAAMCAAQFGDDKSTIAPKGASGSKIGFGCSAAESGEGSAPISSGGGSFDMKSSAGATQIGTFDPSLHPLTDGQTAMKRRRRRRRRRRRLEATGAPAEAAPAAVAPAKAKPQIGSSVASVKVLGANGKEVPIASNSPVLNFEIVTKPGGLPACVYWDTTAEAWSSKGTFMTAARDGIIFCRAMHLTDFAGGAESAMPEMNTVNPADPSALLSYNTENMLVPICLAAMTMIFILSCIVGRAMDKFQQKNMPWRLGLVNAGEQDHRDEGKEVKHITSIWTRVRLLFLESLKQEHLFLNIYFVPGWHPMNRPLRLGLLLASILTMLTVEAMFFGKDNESSSQKLAVTIIACVVCMPPDTIFCYLIDKISTFVGETDADVADDLQRKEHKSIVTVDNPMVLYRSDLDAENPGALVAPSRRMLNNPLVKWDVDHLKDAWRDTSLQRAVDEGKGWKSMTDPATQKEYFWNYLTGQTVWNPWERVLEAETGDVHYHNFVTGEVSWRPVGIEHEEEEKMPDSPSSDSAVSKVADGKDDNVFDERASCDAETTRFDSLDAAERGVDTEPIADALDSVVRPPIAPIKLALTAANAIHRKREEKAAARKWINEELPFVKVKLQAFGLQTCGEFVHEDIVLRVTHLDHEGEVVLLHETMVARNAQDPKWPTFNLQVQDSKNTIHGLPLGESISLECWECDRDQQYIPVVKIGAVHTTVRWLLNHAGDTLRLKADHGDDAETKGGVSVLTCSTTYIPRKDTVAFQAYVASEVRARTFNCIFPAPPRAHLELSPSALPIDLT